MNTPKTMTAALSGKLILPMTPENISTIPLYHVHKNLWDTIVSPHGEPALAKLINTKDSKTFKFELLPNAKFSNGRKIKSEDIVFSLNRLMGKQEGGHFNAKSVIEKVSALDESRFEINLKKPTPSFLFLLSIPEMGIVPKEACDSKENVTNLNITSGAYTVTEQEAGKLVLRKNTFFLRHESLSPDQISILFFQGVDKLVEVASSEEVDFIELYESSSGGAFQKLKQNQKFNYKATKPSYSVFLNSNLKSRLSKSQRLAIADLIHKNLSQNFSLIPEVEVNSYEILPPKTFGSLDIRSHLESGENKKDLPKKIKLTCHDKTSPLVKAIVTTLKNGGVEVDLHDLTEKVDYDFMLLGQGMNADFPEIEFHLNMLSPWAFVAAKDSDKELLNKAIHTADKKTRSELLQKIGKSLLEEGTVIPIIVRSYAHIYRKNRLNVDQVTNYDGDIPFWLMQVKQ